MQEISTMQASGSDNFKRPQVTIGVDLGDRSSNYCVLNATGDILLEDKLPTTSQAMKQLFGGMLRVASRWRRAHTPRGSAGC